MARLTKSVVLAAVALLCAFASTQISAPSAEAAFTDTDGDGIADVAEEVFGSNPNASGSTPETAGDPFFFPDSCTNALDDDGDGAADGADAGCADTDEDIFSDHLEQQFGSDPEDAEYYPEDSRFDNALIRLGFPLRSCANGDDDDDDGFADGADPGCTEPDGDGDGFSDLVEKDTGSDGSDGTSVPEHASFNDGSCSDGDDNDLDGGVDGADDGCVALTNDDLQDALAIDSLPFSHTTKILGATVQPGERESDCVLEEQARTVWYRFVASESGSVVLDAAGSDFTTITSVWAESTFGLTEVTCTNAYPLFTPEPPARVAFQAEAGTTYMIQVGAEEVFYLGSGNLVLNISSGTPPANDDVADAVTIGPLPYSTTVDTMSAGTEAEEPLPSCLASASVQSTVWYSYTATTDGYIAVDTGGTVFPSSMIAVYQSAAAGPGAQVACSYPVPFYYLPDAMRIAFAVQAGETYLIQAGGISYGNSGQSGAAGHGSVGGFVLGGNKGRLTLHIQTFTPPSCPAPVYTVQDPPGDGFGGPTAVDIERLAATVSGGNLCVAVDLRGAVDPANVEALVSIDSDMDRFTGYDDAQYDCGFPTGMGTDTNGQYRPETGLLMLLVTSNGEGGGLETHYGFARLENGVFHLGVPLEGVGGDSSLRFVASVAPVDDFDNDCAPNGGNITCQNGACVFSPFRNGDANCTTGANAIDAAIILQYGAGLLSTLSCPDAADVDGNGVIDSRDAALVLQYAAGLLTQLPPFFFEG